MTNGVFLLKFICCCRMKTQSKKYKIKMQLFKIKGLKTKTVKGLIYLVANGSLKIFCYLYGIFL